MMDFKCPQILQQAFHQVLGPISSPTEVSRWHCFNQQSRVSGLHWALKNHRLSIPVPRGTLPLPSLSCNIKSPTTLMESHEGAGPAEQGLPVIPTMCQPCEQNVH